MNKVTGVVICRNEEDNIGDCLRSIAWCDEIIVVDALSTDGTVGIASGFTKNIFTNEWKGFREQRLFALDKVSDGWVFALDADERCSEELAAEIRSAVSSDEDHAGYLIPRKTYFLGKWIRHGGWYPDHQLRLFRKSSAGVTDRLVHESYSVTGKKGRLNSDIIHCTASSVDEYMQKIVRYAGLSAAEKAGSNPGFFRLLIYPRLEFFKQYILKGNILDGREGLIVSNLHMITKILTYTKVVELQKKR